MKRTVGLAFGVAAALAMGLWLGPSARAEDVKEGKTKVEKRVLTRHGGGAFLGVGLGEVEGDVRGAKVRSVESGSPAEKAGLKEGDVIVRFDGETVRSAGHLARLVGETPAGRAVAIEITRGGAAQKLTATLGEGKPGLQGGPWPMPHEFRFEMPGLPEAPGNAPNAPRALRQFRYRVGPDGDALFSLMPGGRRRLGIEFIDVGEQLAAYLKLSGKTGVLVASVDGDTPAAKAGLKAGDVVLEFDGQKIGDGAELRRAVAKAEGGRAIPLKVQRDGRPLDLQVTLPKPEGERPHAQGITL